MASAWDTVHFSAMSTKELNLETARRRRGVVKGSITRLAKRVQEFEDKEELTKSDISAIKRQRKKLDELNAEFKKLHYAVVDHSSDDDEETLEKE